MLDPDRPPACAAYGCAEPAGGADGLCSRHYALVSEFCRWLRWPYDFLPPGPGRPYLRSFDSIRRDWGDVRETQAP